MLKDLLKASRSYRRFYEDDEIPKELLENWVDNVRYTPSAANAQTLKFKICTGEEEREGIFPWIRWAAALEDWRGPEPGERPSAYVVIVNDKSLGKGRGADEGICAQTIMLSAAEAGYGGCIIGSFERELVAEYLGIDQTRYSVDYILALGRPKETVILTDVGEDGKTAYYRDRDGIHFVPKRALRDILL